METIGSLIDKYSILSIRRSFTKDPEILETIDSIMEKSRTEMDELLSEFQTGSCTKLDVVQPKFKNYAHQDNSVSSELKLSLAIDGLMKANIKLWNIEDERRDPATHRDTRLFLMDQVSVWNKTRNECIDQIDLAIWSKIKSKESV